MRKIFSTLCVLAIFSAANLSFADDSSSSSFTVQSSVIAPTGYGTSAGFQLWGVVSQLAIGTSTASGFSLNPGFLSYPFVSTPAVSTTAGDGSVALTWSASQGFLGWNVSGYRVGQATVSGGPYIYTDLGNVTASTRSGLTNGTTYYFVIMPEDAFGAGIATSTEVSATPVASNNGNNNNNNNSGGSTSGGGISSGNIPPQGGNVTFLGRAYPLSAIVLLKDGQIAVRTQAGADAKFQVNLTSLSAGNYVFSIYGEDKGGNRSASQSFPITLSNGSGTTISGIFIAPSIATDKSEVKKGDNIAIFGQSPPESDIVISVNSENEFFVSTKSDAGGVYLLTFDTSPLELGSHSAKSKASVSGEISEFGTPAPFIVGTKNIAATLTRACPAKGDVNGDCQVNLIDFSIAAYWYKRPLTSVFLPMEKAHLSGDGKVDLTDFSIMAYYWTG